MPRPTVARIDLDAVMHNAAAVRRLVGARKVCAAVKADAYGHGAPAVCHALSAAGVDTFAVAMTEEAVELRGAGILRPIILLTAVPADDVDEILGRRINACVTEEGFARELSEAALRRSRTADVHVKVDTGMHRVGLDWETAARSILRLAELKGLRIAGVFSHFACSDADDLAFSHEQVRRFRTVLRKLEAAGMPRPFVHMANSNGVLRLPGAYFDGVRPGLIFHGLTARPDVRGVLDLRPVLSMRTRVCHLKRLPAGEKLGYGHTYATARESLIATLPIGYHDGFIRQFSNVGAVLVGGRRVPVVGRVCMDQTLVDVTDAPGVRVGDEAVIYGRQGRESISVEEMARRVDRIPYELTCSIGRRVRREFVLDGAVAVEGSATSGADLAALAEALRARAGARGSGELSHDRAGAKPAQRGAA